MLPKSPSRCVARLFQSGVILALALCMTGCQSTLRSASGPRARPAGPILASGADRRPTPPRLERDAEPPDARSGPIWHREERDLDEPSPDHPDEAAQFRWLQRAGPDGTIPPDALIKAKKQRDELVAYCQQQGGSQRDGGILGWQWLGPGNIGGRIRAISINPSNPNDILIGSVSGGIWRSLDAGASWTPMADFMANLAVTTLVRRPDNPSIVLAGTGEGFFNIDALRGAGIFLSTDYGVTWSQLPLTANANFYYVNRIAVSPADFHVVAATNSGLFESRDGSGPWVQAIPGPAGSARFVDVKFDPSGQYAVAATTYDFTAGTGDGRVWRWVHQAGRLNPALAGPGGASLWRPSESNPLSDGRVEVASAPSSPDIVYASVANKNGTTRGLYRSENFGRTFTPVNTTDHFLCSPSSAGGENCQGWYANALWVDPTNPDIVVVGGIDLWRGEYDAGSHSVAFTKISRWQDSPQSAHADQHAIVAHPDFGTDPDGNGTIKSVYFGNDGGIYRTDEIYSTSELSGWTALNNNLGITQFYAGSVNSLGHLAGGTQDNGTLIVTGGGAQAWQSAFGGDGGFCAFDLSDPDRLYGEYVNLKVFRKDTSGTGYIYDGSTGGAPLLDATADPPRANFIAPLILDPNNPQRLLAGGQSLWRANDADLPFVDWVPIKAPSPSSSNISAIAVLKDDSDVIWVAHNDGAVFRTSNGTTASPTWERIDDGANPLPNRYVTDIDLLDQQTAYVSLSGYFADNVWKWEQGSGFTALLGSPGRALPALPVNAIVAVAGGTQCPPRLYAGTDLGVFASDDDGANWSASNEATANVEVDQLIVDPFDNDPSDGIKLYAATHGRGMYVADLDAVAQCLPCVEKLLASDGAPDDEFGRSVAVDGNVIVIAAFSPAGGDVDAAYAYRWDGTAWVEKKLRPSDGSLNFGRSVAVSGDVIAVGSEAEAAYVYRWDGTDWVEEKKLVAHDGALNDRFGFDVAVSGDVIVVGAIGDDDLANLAGAAYVFRWDGGDWIEEQKLYGINGAASDWFGFSIAVDGNVIVVGTWSDDNLGGVDAGAAYVYRWNGTTWIAEKKLVAHDGGANGYFGHDVGVDGDVIVVGAQGHNNFTGAAYVFRRSGGNWIEEQELNASDGEPSDVFGVSVAVDGDLIVVGAPDGLSPYDSAVYTYHWNGSVWVEEVPKRAVNGADDELGFSVALRDNLIVGGARFDDNAGGADAGAAYVFDATCPP